MRLKGKAHGGSKTPHGHREHDGIAANFTGQRRLRGNLIWLSRKRWLPNLHGTITFSERLARMTGLGKSGKLDRMVLMRGWGPWQRRAHQGFPSCAWGKA